MIIKMRLQPFLPSHLLFISCNLSILGDITRELIGLSIKLFKESVLEKYI